MIHWLHWFSRCGSLRPRPGFQVFPRPILFCIFTSADSLQWIVFLGKSTGFSWDLHDLPTIWREVSCHFFLTSKQFRSRIRWNVCYDIIEQSGWIDLESMKDMPTMPSCFLRPSCSKVQEAAPALSRELSLSFRAPATLIPLCFKVAAKEEPRTQKGSTKSLSCPLHMEEPRSEEDSPVTPATKDKTEPRRDDGSHYVILSNVMWHDWYIYIYMIIYVPWRHVPILVLWEGKKQTVSWHNLLVPHLGLCSPQAASPAPSVPGVLLPGCYTLMMFWISTVQLFYLFWSLLLFEYKSGQIIIIH